MGISRQPSRRQVLKTATAAVAGAVGSSLARNVIAAPATAPSGKDLLTVIFHELDGTPLDAVRMKQLDARDLHIDPLPLSIKSEGSTARIELPGAGVGGGGG